MKRIFVSAGLPCWSTQGLSWMILADRFDVVLTQADIEQRLVFKRSNFGDSL